MLKLKEIYQKYCSDSDIDGGDKGTIHSYIDNYYEKSLEPIRNKARRIVEIGINNGHSLKMWKEYFYNHSNLIGVDINDIQLPGVKTIKGDATLEETFNGIDNIDIVIDDGSHKFKHQILTFNILFPRLNEGGIYIIEDIIDIDKNKEKFLGLHPNVKIYDFRHLKNRSDDVIVEIIK